MSGLGYIIHNSIVLFCGTLWCNGENFPIDCLLCIFIIDIWLFFVQKYFNREKYDLFMEILLLLLQCVQPSLYKILFVLFFWFWFQMQQHLQKWNSKSMKHYYYCFFFTYCPVASICLLIFKLKFSMKSCWCSN